MNVLSTVSLVALLFLLAVVNGAPKPTNTNQCVMTVGRIALNIGACTDPNVGCCLQVIQAYSEGCFCNPSTEVLFGSELMPLLTTLLPQCRANLFVEDVDCKKLRSYNYGCKTEDMALDAARLTAINEMGVVSAGIDTTLKFENCSSKILEIVPSKTMAWLASTCGFIANDFEMWGIDSICEYHEMICRPNNFTTYENKEDCLNQIGQLPKHSVACGPDRAFAGNSLGCKFKHHFMAPLEPENHCKHIGPEYTPDGEGALKCVDAIECPIDFPL